MSLITITQAAELTGKSVPTLYRHIKQGKLSRRSDGLIDVSELLRVYGELRISDYQNNTHAVSSDNHDIAWYRNQIELLQAQLVTQREEFLEREKRLMLFLEHLPTEDKPTKKSKKKKKSKGGRDDSLLDRIAQLINR